MVYRNGPWIGSGGGEVVRATRILTIQISLLETAWLSNSFYSKYSWLFLITRLEVEWAWARALRPEPNFMLAEDKPQPQGSKIFTTGKAQIRLKHGHCSFIKWKARARISVIRAQSGLDIQSSGSARARKNWARSTSTLSYEHCSKPITHSGSKHLNYYTWILPKHSHVNTKVNFFGIKFSWL